MRPEDVLVVLDTDGPKAQFVTGFLSLIEEETGHAFGPAVVTEWEITESPFFLTLVEEVGRDPKELTSAVWRRANRIGFCSSLAPVPGSQEGVQRLREMGVQVEVVTSPLVTNPTWMTERFEWLQRNYGFKKDQIHLVAKKQRVPGDFLIDDKPSHVLNWSEASKDAARVGRGLLWDAPYNQDTDEEFERVRSWDQVCDKVEAYLRSLVTPAAYSR